MNSTGKMFDIQTRGCVPIANYRAPYVPGVCTQNGINLCLWGGVALGVIALGVVAGRRRGGVAAPLKMRKTRKAKRGKRK